jgi:hypothetical protein
MGNVVAYVAKKIPETIDPKHKKRPLSGGSSPGAACNCSAKMADVKLSILASPLHRGGFPKQHWAVLTRRQGITRKIIQLQASSPPTSCHSPDLSTVFISSQVKEQTACFP